MQATGNSLEAFQALTITRIKSLGLEPENYLTRACAIYLKFLFNNVDVLLKVSPKRVDRIIMFYRIR